MAKAGSPVIMPFGNDALLHHSDAFIYLVTAKKCIEILKSKIDNELLSHFALFCVVRESTVEHLFPKLQTNLVHL